MAKDEDMDMRILQSHLAQLGEHFDTVQIFVTRHDPSRGGGTMVGCVGAGNWFARYGQVKAWVKAEESAFSGS